MFTFKNVMTLGLFLFGTTFLWMTASFAGKTPVPTSTAWTVVNVLALVAVAGFTIAAWGVFKDHGWWPTVSVISGVVGLATVVPYVIALRQIDVGFADLGVEINLWMHVVGSAAAIALVVMPSAHLWVERRL